MSGAACKCGHAHDDHAPPRTECMEGDCKCRGYAPPGAKWTPRKYNAAIGAINVMIAARLERLAFGERAAEEGEAGIRFADLEAARDLLNAERESAARARDERIDAKLRAELRKVGAR